MPGLGPSLNEEEIILGDGSRGYLKTICHKQSLEASWYTIVI